MRIHRHRRHAPKKLIPDYKRNEEIQAQEVRLVHGEAAEVVPLKKALELARSEAMDLIEISPSANPPVCKIMDFGSFKYQKEKEAKKQRAASKEVDTKGIRLTMRIGENDIDVRRKQAIKFLEKGNKVRIEIVMRGREKAFQDRAKMIVNDFIEKLEETYPLRKESPIKRAGRGMFTIVSRTS